MLDKNIPHADVIMCRKAGTPLPDISLPDGYHFSFYQTGNEKDWAAIETSVLEFSDEMAALAYFEKTFLPHVQELKMRCLFVENSQHEKVATATAWWRYSGLRRQPLVHWVAVKPSHQGLRLGKAVTAAVLHRMAEIEGDCDFYLHTQTWSHKAIKIYENMGFAITEESDSKAKSILAEIRTGR